MENSRSARILALTGIELTDKKTEGKILSPKKSENGPFNTEEVSSIPNYRINVGLKTSLHTCKKNYKWFCNRPLSPLLEDIVNDDHTSLNLTDKSCASEDEELIFSDEDDSVGDPEYIQESSENEPDSTSEKPVVSHTPVAESVVTGQNKQKKNRIRERDFCFYCDTEVLNFARHIIRNHASEIEVQRILATSVKSKERKNLITVLRKKGNYLMNIDTCVKPMKKLNFQDKKRCLPCSYCLGYYSAKYLWRHRKRCKQNPNNSTSSNAKAEAHNLLTNHLVIDKKLRETVFPRMRPDMISLAAKKDELICAFGARYIKIHREKHFVNVASRKMRELSKLLIEIRKLEPSIKNLFQSLKPEYYELVVQAAKIVAQYNENNEQFLSPTYAMNIATTLKQCCEIAIIFALKKKSVYTSVQTGEAEASLRTMIQLFESQWKFDISSQASDDLHLKKWNKITIVPLASDIKILKEYLTIESNIAADKLSESNYDVQAYIKLLETIFCRIILLNRKRPGELQRLPLHIYESVTNDPVNNYEEFSQTISPTEKILMQRFKRIVIRGKRGRGVPVLLSTDVQDHIKLLLKYRTNFINKENTYLFAKPNFNTPICGYKVLSKYAKACGAQNPLSITSTRLRKHLATITQIFNMSNNDIEQLASFMGHTSDVHRKAYRLPDDVYQTAKISKLLLLMEKGAAAEYKGKSIEEIDMNLDNDLLSENDSDEDLNIIADEINDACSTVETRNQENDITIQTIKNKRTLTPWTAEQKNIVNSYFCNHIRTCKPPKKNECEELKTLHSEVLQNKCWLKIKVYVQNQYMKKK